MKTFARLILSLEKLIKNPVSWFDQQPWLLRIFVVILFVPLISLVSIFGYQRLGFDAEKNASINSYEKLSQEVNDLKQNSQKFHDSQMEELYYLSDEVAQLKEEDEDAVLGAEDSKVAEEVDDGLVYIKTDIEEVDVFAGPSDSSKKTTTIEPGSFHPALSEKDDWQQIYLGDGQIGWIKKEFINKSPNQ